MLMPSIKYQDCEVHAGLIKTMDSF